MNSETSNTASEAPKNIHDLPLDILLDILDFVDGACLALCNRRLAGLIGEKSWKRLQYDDLHTLTKLLAKDNPQYSACNLCHKLHLIRKVDWPNMYPLYHHSGREFHCPSLPDEWHYPKHYLQLKDHSLFKMTLTHVQLATSGELPLEAFRHTEVDFSGGISRGGHLERELFSTEARITNGELLLRTQHWYVVSSLYRDDIMEEGIIRCVCEHMRAMNEWRDECWDDEYKKLLKCRLNHLNGKTKIRKCRRCTKLNGCEYCYMEFKIESKEIEEGATGDDSESIAEDAVEEVDSESEAQGSDSSDSEDSDWDPDDSDHEADSNLSVIHITRYLNLGSGQTSTDPKWTNHLTETEDSKWIKYRRGSIGAAFDKVGGKSLEDLTAENEKKLLSFERPYNQQLSFKWTKEGIWKRTRWDSWVLMGNEVRRFPTFKEQLLQNKEDVRFEKSLNAKTRI